MDRAGTLAMIDARMEAALARLTNNEKECLRRRLRQQTAKEMALELGVSPHAVEKRLKMARTKLGLSSSLEAARLLVASEGYQRSGPQAPDLAQAARDDQKPAGRLWLAGGIVMGVILVSAIAFALQSSGGATTDPERNEQDHWTMAEQVDSVVTRNFAAMDRDRSGFLEPGEIPAPAEEERRAYIAAGDKNSDGKLDFAEYRGWLVPIMTARAAEGRKYVEEYFSRAHD